MKCTSLPLRRREFISLLGGAAARGRSRRGRSRRSRYVASASCLAPRMIRKSRRNSLRSETASKAFGWSEGRNVQIDYRFASATIDTTQVLASELIAWQPDVILGDSTRYTAALQQQTRPISNCI